MRCGHKGWKAGMQQAGMIFIRGGDTAVPRRRGMMAIGHICPRGNLGGRREYLSSLDTTRVPGYPRTRVRVPNPGTPGYGYVLPGTYGGAKIRPPKIVFQNSL